MFTTKKTTSRRKRWRIKTDIKRMIKRSKEMAFIDFSQMISWGILINYDAYRLFKIIKRSSLQRYPLRISMAIVFAYLVRSPAAWRSMGPGFSGSVRGQRRSLRAHGTGAQRKPSFGENKRSFFLFFVSFSFPKFRKAWGNWGSLMKKIRKLLKV